MQQRRPQVKFNKFKKTQKMTQGLEGHQSHNAVQTPAAKDHYKVFGMIWESKAVVYHGSVEEVITVLTEAVAIINNQKAPWKLTKSAASTFNKNMATKK